MENSDVFTIPPGYYIIQEINVQFIAFLLSSVYQLNIEIFDFMLKKANVRNCTAKKYEL